MGWKSTINISRDEALRLIYENLENCDDESISEILELALDKNHGHNYSIDNDASSNGRNPV